MTESLLLAGSAALILACGMFVAAEFAFVTVDRSTVDRQADSGDRGAVGVQQALRALSTQLSGAQVGITITNLAIGYLAEPAIARLIDDPLVSVGVPDGAVRGVALTTGLLLATTLTMVFGELVPKNLAIARPMAVARATQGWQRGFTTAMALPIRLLNGSANTIVRWFGIEPQEELRSARNSDELASLIGRSEQEGTLDAGTAQLMQRSVAFGQRTAGEIMTPRVRMDSIDARAKVHTLVELARSTGHSRFPVVGGEADNVVGSVHVKNAVSVPFDDWHRVKVRGVMGQVTVVPESLRLDPLLERLRSEGFQMAVVLDEYGGTAGVVTLEDVVEEIVGEIADEHDPPDRQARDRGDGTWTVSGLLRPDEVEDRTGLTLPTDGDYDTVAGLVVRLLGRMPEVGDEVAVPLPQRLDDDDEPEPPEQAVLTVRRLDGRRIDRLDVVRRLDPDPRASHRNGEGGHR